MLVLKKIDLKIASLSISRKRLLRSMRVFTACSLTVMLAMGLATSGASSTGLRLIFTVAGLTAYNSPPKPFHLKLTSPLKLALGLKRIELKSLRSIS